MAITTKTGTVSYSAGYSYDTIAKGTQKFPYTAVYDSETNATTVTFGTCQHNYYGRSGYITVAITTLTVSDVEDSSIKGQSIFFTSGTTNGSQNYKVTGSPGINQIVIQHTNIIGEKSVKIAASTILRCYPNSSSVESGNSLQYSGSGNVTVTLGAYDGSVLYNADFVERKGALVATKWGATGNNQAVALVVEYSTIYSASSNTTEVKINNVRIRQSGMNNYPSTSSGTITIAATDNTADATSITFSHKQNTTGGYINYYPTLSESSIVLSHTEGLADPLRSITINVSADISLYSSAGSQWKFTFTMASSTLVIGSINDRTFGIPIDNGEELLFYQIYIDDGKAWQSADCHIDLRTQWLKSE